MGSSYAKIKHGPCHHQYMLSPLRSFLMNWTFHWKALPNLLKSRKESFTEMQDKLTSLLCKKKRFTQSVLSLQCFRFLSKSGLSGVDLKFHCGIKLRTTGAQIAVSLAESWVPLGYSLLNSQRIFRGKQAHKVRLCSHTAEEPRKVI